MDGPIISFDVSKGESHMRAFISNGKPFGKVIRIRHDNQGFELISNLHLKLKEQTGVAPAVIYEFTGVYAMPLLSYFISMNYRIYQISPLESAKMRKAEVRPTKNDSLDTTTIAKVYYSRDINPFVPHESIREDFREMSRQYQYELAQSVEEMNRYHRCLDAVWPLFDEIIDYSSESSLKIVEHFGHPSNIKTTKGVLSLIKDIKPGRSCSREELARRVVEYCSSHKSGTRPDSYLTREMKDMAGRVKKALDRRKQALEEMISLAVTLPEFETLKTLPAVSDLSAVRLLSEIGDISRYSSAKAFIAYIGIDPMVMQSGKQSGEHMHITKKGNAWLRTTLYLIVGNICRCEPDSKIAKYVMKKKNDGLCHKAAKIAGCGKLARIVYSMLRNGTCYSEK